MYRHILVPLDGSALAEAILPHARALTLDKTAQITLLRSVRRIPAHTIEFDKTAPSPRGEVSQHEAEAKAYLAPLVAQMRDEGYRAEAVVVLQNDPHEAIIDYALYNGVDIIALVTHGRGGLGRMVFGSVAERLLHQSPLPLLVIRPSATG
jgi:nucleotide-binding universal stress UspA family protein